MKVACEKFKIMGIICETWLSLMERGSNRWPRVIPRKLNVIGIDSNYFSLLISVDVCLGSPVAELLGSHNTEEEVAHYRNHARVPWAFYPQLDPWSFVFPFLSSLFSSHPWLSTAGTLAASGRLLGLPIVCVVIVAAGMNLASLRSNMRRDKNNDRKTLTLHKLFLVLWLLLKNKAIRK